MHLANKKAVVSDKFISLATAPFLIICINFNTVNYSFSSFKTLQ
ncbi:hypothetical protein SpAn4DRAFT_0098 [Sporomusa ovata]|uniref:Uncharacterized protein n=1 Tax=Sporomusa ovata TaxID=2378 RepID=A0A0U1L1T1_9FIRM|nr:hypothetical protein SpAn4DRAFT_0098 [Sporomusa ovata]